MKTTYFYSSKQHVLAGHFHGFGIQNLAGKIEFSSLKSAFLLLKYLLMGLIYFYLTYNQISISCSAAFNQNFQPKYFVTFIKLFVFLLLIINQSQVEVAEQWEEREGGGLKTEIRIKERIVETASNRERERQTDRQKGYYSCVCDGIPIKNSIQHSHKNGLV